MVPHSRAHAQEVAAPLLPLVTDPATAALPERALRAYERAVTYLGTRQHADGRVAGEVVRVRLHARVTEAGTLELEALPHDGAQRWKVEFDVRAGADD